MTNKMKQAPKTVSKAKSGQVVDGRWRCEQVPGASCPFVRARRCLPARHHCPHYLFTGCHLVDQRPHLGRRAFGAVGRHIRTHRLPGWATPRCTCPPATCPPTTATSPNNSDAQIAYCLEATWQTTIFTHQGHIKESGDLDPITKYMFAYC